MNQTTIPRTTRELLMELMPDNKKLTSEEIQEILPVPVHKTTLLRAIIKLKREGKIRKTKNLSDLGRPHYAKIANPV